MKKAENPLSLVENTTINSAKSENGGDYVHCIQTKRFSIIASAIEKCSVSDASVLRFADPWFSGYQDFKAALVPELLKRGTSIIERSILGIILRLFEKNSWRT